MDAEQAVGIAPRRAWDETGLAGEHAEVIDRVFVRPLGVDRFAFGEGYRAAQTLTSCAAVLTRYISTRRCSTL